MQAKPSKEHSGNDKITHAQKCSFLQLEIPYYEFTKIGSSKFENYENLEPVIHLYIIDDQKKPH